MYVPLYEPTAGKTQQKLVTFLADILEQRRAWKQPKQKKEPYMYEMFVALSDFLLLLQKSDAKTFLQVEWSVLDWSRLGCHTGSRLGEYGQSKPKKGQLFATMPDSPNAGEWAGRPIAFIRDDFSLFDDSQIRQSTAECLEKLELAIYVHIRFRFDKSPNKFIIGKFRRIPGSLLCPVKAVLSILRRADLLGVPDEYPLGAFRPKSSAPNHFAFLNGEHVQQTMQLACRLVYLDPRHYMRLNIHLIMSHSNRVMAAVALHNAGVQEEVIAHCLNWTMESVKFYIRDCFNAVGSLTLKAIKGAFYN